MLTTDALRDEMAMPIHLLAGQYIAQGFPVEIVQLALKKAVDLVPELEADTDFETN